MNLFSALAHSIFFSLTRLNILRLFYLASNIPATLAWSTSAGWACNKGFVWLLAAAGFYDGLRKKRVRVMASSIQSIFGIIALALAISVGVKVGLHQSWGAESNWVGSVAMLAVSVVLTIVAAILGSLSPTHHQVETIVSGWADANDATRSERKLIKSRKFERVAPKTCGDLGVCGVCNVVCSFILLIIWLVLVVLAIDFRVKEPATYCYAILPQTTGVLTMDEAMYGESANLGPYTIAIDENGLGLSVKRGSKVVFATLPGEPFVRVGYGPFSAKNELEMGTYIIDDANNQLSFNQDVASMVASASSIVISGVVSGFAPGSTVQTSFALNFTVPDGTNHLAFELIVDDAPIRTAFGNSGSDQIRLYWIHDSVREERFFGFGQSFTYWDLKGTCLPIITREQGIGRGLQPFTYLINKVAHEAAGSWQTTYSAVPHYVTNRVRSFFLDESYFSVFDLTRFDRMSVELVSSRMRARFLSEDNYFDTIEQYTLHSGRMRPLPDWVGEGAVIGLQGGREKVKRQTDLLLELGVPLTGVWLQDWSGRRVTLLGDRLLWNWQVNQKLYPGWGDFIAQYRSQNISMLTYINPYLADYAPNENGERVIQPMFSEAKDMDCLVKNKDDSVLIQISATSDFTFATIDLTNPTCKSWYTSIIRSNMMNISAADDGKAYGSLGWMADFAESLPFDAQLFNGNGAELHNRLPSLWAEACREAINVVSGGVDFSQEVAFFTRSSSADSPKHTTLMWLGDQMQAFNRFDGLETVIPATASMGLSGFSLSHSDIGGYLAFSQLGGVIQLHRSVELLLRWMEQSAFMDVMFRTHEGILPAISPQVTSDNSTIKQFARFANIFKALHPYRKTLMAEASAKGYPVARHPLLHYPNDPNLELLRKQVMLGSELMLCAVTRPGASSTECYLPAGSGIWTSFFDQTFTKDATGDGLMFDCPAPLGRPCALVKQGAVFVPAARANLASQGFEF